MATLAILSSAYPITAANTANATTYENFLAYPIPTTAIESSARTIFRAAGTLSNLYVRLTANSCSGNTVYTTRKNTATDGVETITFASGVTGDIEDTSNTDAVTAGDTWYVKIVPASGSTGTNSITVVRVLFGDSTPTNTTTRLGAAGGFSFTAASTNYYIPLQGLFHTSNTSEANLKALQRKAGTMKNMAILITANTRTDTNTLQSRQDTGAGSVNGNLIISVTSGQTGILEDNFGLTGHSDTINVGDKYNFTWVTGTDSTHSLTARSTMCDFLSTSGYTQCVTGYGFGSSSISTTTAVYNVLSGRQTNSTTPGESAAQIKASQSMIFSNLSVGIAGNAATAASTFRFRKNAANGNQVISIASGATGYFTDTTNTDAVVAADELNYSWVSGSAGAVTIQHFSSWAVTGTSLAISDTLTLTDH